MSNEELNKRVEEFLRRQRRLTGEILRLILLAEDRKLHLELGYSSVFDWLVKGHGLSERSAMRRLLVCRLVRAVPLASEKIESGALQLSVLARAQSIIQTHERASGLMVDAEVKTEAVLGLEGLTLPAAERFLYGLFPFAASTIYEERLTTLDALTTRLALNLANEVIDDLRRAREVLSHAIPSGRFADVIAYVIKDFLDRRDPLRKQCASTLPAQSGEDTAQELTQAVRDAVVKRAGGVCEFTNPVTGQKCGSRHLVQVDHIRPLALGGGNEIENLRALCRSHNLYMAEKLLGAERANRWRRH